MWQWIKDTLTVIHETFHGSGSIWLARLNMLGGAMLTGALMLDPSSFGLDPKWVTLWTATNGAIAEYLRRRGATYDPDGNLV